MASLQTVEVKKWMTVGATVAGVGRCASGNNEIKNCAVKYSAAPQPTAYALLQEKTDLKLPPANWLRESPQRGPAGTSVLGSSSKSKPFSRTSRRSPTASPMSVWQSTVWEGLSF
ncbi:erythroid differentiation-related factor 1-like [Oncorhynchus keta]|uniref:erythroid differentiation-related factor 1-like n=1 Tax=Oncorhynchus keta TaxID=8018 RepID=UPI0015FA19FE|nr:erythroid differentiation-related factor 1-like [Oncorhynchus keta]